MSISKLSRFVIAYMILAFGWWAYHLWERNDKIFADEQQLLEYKFSAGNKGINLTQLHHTAEYANIVEAWKKGRRMVIAEGLFFTACLVFGLWVIRRSADREVSLAKQRRNFLLSITHELKSPIASIRLAIETLQRPSLAEEHRGRLLNNGLKDADRLQTLVEELLLAARLEDQWRPLPEPVNLKAVVEDCRDNLKIRFPQANIIIQFGQEVPALVADKAGITAVVKNLIENAVKYAPEGSPVQVTIDRSGNHCRIQVADKGPGIPDTEKERVFEKFYRIGNEDTRKSTGTGLGLYIVQQVVKAHKGSIQLQHNTPSGAIFTVLI